MARSFLSNRGSLLAVVAIGSLTNCRCQGEHRSTASRPSVAPDSMPMPSIALATEGGVRAARDADGDSVKSVCGAHEVADLTPLSRSLFPAEQRSKTAKFDWRVPERFEEERSGERRIILGNASLSQCQVFKAGSSFIAGPFAGIASDASWRATEYSHDEGDLLVVLDHAGVIRAVRHLDPDGPNRGGSLEALSLFPGGKSLAPSTYQYADGWTVHSRWVLGFDEGELRVLLTVTESAVDGSVEEFKLTEGAAAGVPFLTIAFAARSATVIEEDGGLRAVRARRWQKTAHYNAASKTFR